MASESELIAKEEVDQFVRLMEESGQRIEELESEQRRLLKRWKIIVLLSSLCSKN